MNTQTYTHTQITVIYNDTPFISQKLDLIDQDIANIVFHILDNGTSELESFQLPMDNDELIIFSREQLDLCVFKFKFFTEKVKPVRKKRITDEE